MSGPLLPLIDKVAKPKVALRLAEVACNQISERLGRLNISVNAGKTDCVIFSFQKGKSLLPTSYIVGTEGNSPANDLVYRGIKMERHLHFSNNFAKELKLTRTKSYRLAHLLTSPNLSLRLKLLIYKSILRPTLLYGAPLFRYLTYTTAKKLQQFQNGILMKAVRGTSFEQRRNSELHEIFELPTVDEFIERRHIKFFDSLQYLTNPVFNTITPAPFPHRWQDAVAAGTL